MRVIKAAVSWVWSQVAEILDVEFPQGVYQRIWLVHGPCGERVGLVLIASRPPTSQRRNPKGYRPGNKSEEQQSHGDAALFKTKTPVEPILPCQPRDNIKSDE